MLNTYFQARVKDESKSKRANTLQTTQHLTGGEQCLGVSRCHRLIYIHSFILLLRTRQHTRHTIYSMVDRIQYTLTQYNKICKKNQLKLIFISSWDPFSDEAN